MILDKTRADAQLEKTSYKNQSKKYFEKSPLYSPSSTPGFWLCMFDFAKLLYPNMFLRKTFNWTFCREARFSCTILRNTSFRGALMHKANFRAANLKEANFRDAILWGTDFTGAYLSGCSLAGCGFADFALFSQPGRGAGGGREVGQLHGAAGYVDDSSDISSDFASCKIPEHSNGYERALYSAIWCYIMAFTQGRRTAGLRYKWDCSRESKLQRVNTAVNGGLCVLWCCSGSWHYPFL